MMADIVVGKGVSENGSGFFKGSGGGGNLLPKKAIMSSEMVAVGNIMDEEVLQDYAQAVVEELQKRGACTTLALAKMLGMEKSTELNPLLYLLQEKNVLIRVTDVPQFWSLSPDFPITRLASPVDPVAVAPTAQARAQGIPIISTTTETPHCVSLPNAGFGSSPPSRVVLPSHRSTKPVITSPPVPAEPEPIGFLVAAPTTPHALQQLSAEYWPTLNQNSHGKDSRSGGPAFKTWKKQKNLTGLQLHLLKELKKRGPTKTLDLSRSVGLITCKDVNPSIYNLERRNLVHKVNYSPAIWQLTEPGMTRDNIDLNENGSLLAKDTTPDMSAWVETMQSCSQGHPSVSPLG